MSEEIYFNNPCCCDCPLGEGVGWIASLEFLWGITNAAVGIAYIVMSHNAAASRSGWKAFWNEHQHGVIGIIFLHSFELVLALFLMIASSRRIKSMCLGWIVGITLVFVAELVCTILDPFSLTFVMIGINPIRIYFAFIVWSLAAEISLYPQGPPVTRVIQQPVTTTYVERPVYASAGPVIVPSYGYGGYGYGGYPYGGYGYGPGYYGGDAALLGIGLGAGIGLGMGGGYGGCSYGGGYYDDCYF